MTLIPKPIVTKNRSGKLIPTPIQTKEREIKDFSHKPRSILEDRPEWILNTWWMEINLDTNEDLYRNLLQKLDIKNPIKIVEFGSYLEDQSQVLVKKMLGINSSLGDELPEYFLSIATLIKSSTKKKGIINFLFDMSEDIDLCSLIKKVQDQEQKIKNYIPNVESKIKNLEVLFEESKSLLKDIELHCEVLIIAEKFFIENQDKLDAIILSNISLLSKRLSSLTELKLSVMRDPFSIYNSRLLVISSISLYKSGLSVLLHDWYSHVNLEIQHKPNSYKEFGRRINSLIETGKG